MPATSCQTESGNDNDELMMLKSAILIMIMKRGKNLKYFELDGYIFIEKALELDKFIYLGYQITDSLHRGSF